MQNFVQYLLGNKFLEHMPNIALMFCHRNCFLIEPCIFERNANRSGNGLEEIFIIKSELPGYLVKNFDNPDHFTLGYHRYTKRRTGCKT